MNKLDRIHWRLALAAVRWDRSGSDDRRRSMEWYRLWRVALLNAMSFRKAHDLYRDAWFG